MPMPMPMPMHMHMLTVGHSTRTIEAFLEILRAHAITHLVDVRRYPASRRNPQFNQDTLAAALAETGIGYTHEPDLGGRRSPRPDSPNTYWENKQFRGFADHAASVEFAAALARVVDRAHRQVVALMCAEAVPWRCHRRIISDWLVTAGHEVTHVLDERHAESHAVNPAARADPNGQLTYPAGQGRLF